MVLTQTCVRMLAGLTIIIMLSSIPIRGTVASEVILTAENLNDTLKQMQRIRQDTENADSSARADGLYQIGVLARDLAALLSEEVALYDSQQGGLIKLALERSRELGLNLGWIADKKRFIYDGKVFEEYLRIAPDGTYAGESAYLILETEFVRAEINEPVALQEAAAHKSDYLQRYPAHVRAPEVGLLLAIDYRDLWRLYRSTSDSMNEARYRDLTLNQFRQVMEQYAGARQARVAEGLLARFETELKPTTETLP
jgi:hypothetical protein